MSIGKELYIISGSYGTGGTGLTREDTMKEVVPSDTDDTPLLDTHDAEAARLAAEEVEVMGGWGASQYQHGNVWD